MLSHSVPVATTQNMDRACDKPLRTCMTLNDGAALSGRQGIAEPITKAESMEILEQCKEAGLAQTADNVQQRRQLHL